MALKQHSMMMTMPNPQIPFGSPSPFDQEMDQAPMQQPQLGFGKQLAL